MPLKFRNERLGCQSIKVVTIGQVDGLNGNDPIPARDDIRVGLGLCCAISRYLRVQSTGKCGLPSELCVFSRRRVFSARESATGKLAGRSSTRITARHTPLPCEQFERSRKSYDPVLHARAGIEQELTRSPPYRPGNTRIRLFSCALLRARSVPAASLSSRCTPVCSARRSASDLSSCRTSAGAAFSRRQGAECCRLARGRRLQIRCVRGCPLTFHRSCRCSPLAQVPARARLAVSGHTDFSPLCSLAPATNSAWWGSADLQLVSKGERTEHGEKPSWDRESDRRSCQGNVTVVCRALGRQFWRRFAAVCLYRRRNLRNEAYEPRDSSLCLDHGPARCILCARGCSGFLSSKPRLSLSLADFAGPSQAARFLKPCQDHWMTHQHSCRCDGEKNIGEALESGSKREPIRSVFGQSDMEQLDFFFLSCLSLKSRGIRR